MPEPFDRYLLALHHRCLLEAHPHVRPGGGVLTAIGGRMPHEVAFDLHRACGYEPELLAFDVKRAVEPGLVVPPTPARRSERRRVHLLRGRGDRLVAAARDTGLDGRSSPTRSRRTWPPCASAREAERRTARGEPVAHAVLMIFGRQPTRR